MSGRALRTIGVLMALGACAVAALGCGDDDSTSATTSSTASSSSAEQSIDAAVQSCEDEAAKLGEAAGAGLKAACTTAGDNAKKALSEGGEQGKQALAQAADSCKQAVAQLPKGQEQSALNGLCSAMEPG